ncbi:glycoside hydrolase family 79 protein [Zopfia rhizophila CBS 207.26]|uniref:Glycoside hydrolase family 79 protein n=1 Tax=Zopfia rhizophila CBS 207.26 TaxID=1314779 RepID=A0A6A6EGZ4_9PEZI|nr:glycoside hydrolase family 79 protein [Zopfia rhizophila CBS 207.26]
MKPTRFLNSLTLLLAGNARALNPIPLSPQTPHNASDALLRSFVSFSIELWSFPDFAGNLSAPNTFSYDLLRNIGEIRGDNPIIRIGGNTMDFTIFDPNQREALKGNYTLNITRDYPFSISMGPSFFESYQTWDNFSFIHGFNLESNDTKGYHTLVETVPLMCKALKGNRLAYWQIGNEPDLFKTFFDRRPAWWDEEQFAREWLSKTRLIKELVRNSCPEVIENGKYMFYAPAFAAGPGNTLNISKAFDGGLAEDDNIAFIDMHNYISGSTVPGVTLANTLMNHTSTVHSVNKHLNQSAHLSYLGIPYILGEANSLYGQGASGLSNSFGAALWGVDFNLYCAATGIRRVHMHQGTNYRYASWQPVQRANVTKGTKAPYYGNIAVANVLGDISRNNTRISNIDLASDHETAYAVYVDGKLARIALLQLSQYNYTSNTTNQPATRPNSTFIFQVPQDSGVKKIFVQRLMANGSDAISGITFDGYSYNYELDEGKPVLQNNITRGESILVGEDGLFDIDLPWSSGAVLHIN